MSHFYGFVQGNRGDATRMGSRDSGFEAWAQDSTARVHTRLRYDGYSDSNLAEIRIDGSTKNYAGGTVSLTPLHIDSIVRNTDHPDVIEAIAEVNRALNDLNNAALAADGKSVDA